MGNNATKFNLTDYLLATLAVQAHQIADAGHNGWGNTMTSAADMTVEQFIAHVGRVDALIGGR